MNTSPESGASKITIHIDKQPYKVAPGPTAVATLRQLPQPPVATGREIWLDIDDAQDEKLDDTGTIDLIEGLRFFTRSTALRSASIASTTRCSSGR
jgi:hypothetical protein